MPKEKGSFWKMLIGDEPDFFERFKHDFTSGDEGEWGEKCIAELLKNRVENPDSLFQNVYVPTPNGTTELDLVWAGQTGIYVFESKAYGGKIYGHPDHLNWVQYVGKTKNTFYNPIKQNENHCRRLSEALAIPPENIVSFVVFENRTDISKVTKPDDKNIVVCNRNQLHKCLFDVVANRKQIFDENELASICSQLKQWSSQDANVKQEHIQQIHDRLYRDTCPLCGKQLVERKGKYGSFIGCSGYPNCKFTRQNK